MSRTSGAVRAFVVNFLVGYLLGRLLRGRKVAIRAGVALGVVGAVGRWLTAGRADLPDRRNGSSDGDAEPIEIEV